MVLDEQSKKQLIERLKVGRAKKKAEKEAAAPKEVVTKVKKQPKPRKVEYKDLTKIVEEEPLESDDEIVEVQTKREPEPKVVIVPEPEPTVVNIQAPEDKVDLIKTNKDNKEKFMKVIFYKEPSRRQLKIIDTIQDDSSDEESDPQPAKTVKNKRINKTVVAKEPKKNKIIEPTAEEKHYAYLKKLADEFF